jgi:hypothetical protein
VGATVHSQCLLSLTTSILLEKERMEVSRESKSKLEIQLAAEHHPVITADGSDSSAAKKKRKQDADEPLYIKRI